jgi:hypothetical protein
MNNQGITRLGGDLRETVVTRRIGYGSKSESGHPYKGVWITRRRPSAPGRRARLLPQFLASPAISTEQREAKNVRFADDILRRKSVIVYKLSN